MSRARLIVGSLLASMLISTAVLGAAPDPAATRGLLLDACVVEGIVFAVGEHGALIQSVDSGKTWTAVPLPMGGTFTGIKFADTHHGWIVGHGGTVLATDDDGRTWRQQAVAVPEDTSFLDLAVLDAIHVIAVGSFGTFESTSDAGRSWKRRKVLSEELHLSSVSRGRGTEFFVAGERGTLLRFPNFSDDPVALSTDYQGSFNGVLLLSDGSLLAYGLRGHAFRSEDDGLTWKLVPGLSPVTLSTGIQLKSGAVVLAGQARTFLVSHDGAKTFIDWPAPLTTAVAKLVEAPDGSLLSFGEGGVNRIAFPTTADTSTVR